MRVPLKTAAFDALGLCFFVGSAVGGDRRLTLDLINAVYGRNFKKEFMTDLGKEVIRVKGPSMKPLILLRPLISSLTSFPSPEVNLSHIFRYNGNRKEMGRSFFNPSLKLPFLRGADFCYLTSVSDTSKKPRSDFHIFTWDT